MSPNALCARQVVNLLARHRDARPTSPERVSLEPPAKRVAPRVRSAGRAVMPYPMPGLLQQPPARSLFRIEDLFRGLRDAQELAPHPRQRRERRAAREVVLGLLGLAHQLDHDVLAGLRHARCAAGQVRLEQLLSLSICLDGGTCRILGEQLDARAVQIEVLERPRGARPGRLSEERLDVVRRQEHDRALQDAEHDVVLTSRKEAADHRLDPRPGELDQADPLGHGRRGSPRHTVADLDDESLPQVTTPGKLEL
ncbi:hypothetical protein [Sorangium sp. So ce1151]|uniref:hypothetical protein n=1 Tax=Sorangium sp. So ce1151 TaxID=3133332 RepID=UPI003F5FD832